MTTAVLIDDHIVFREGLKLLFEEFGGPRVVGETSRPEEAAALVASTSPDVVVLDMNFPAAMDGISVAAELLKGDPSRRVLFLTMAKDPGRVADALRIGAMGYVTKDQAAAELIRAVQSVARGQQYLSEPLRRALDESGAGGSRRERLSRLTPREREVFDLTVLGLTSQEVGDRLGISARTVETHRARIMSKVQAHSAADLVRLAAEAGVLPDEPRS